ncbi:hypothetical protein T4D_2441 [Trichinella pseudospiralis]|uniref:Uncharacterized protein n=1 Tax=Trichinella pseudospiralis TaxID=6337 RepID=A0A0V1FU19_TRIPS|nr:hypothetical protein T4D_2441 [Trichinella pseudospiralis]
MYAIIVASCITYLLQFCVILTLCWTVLAWKRMFCASKHIYTSCQAYHRLRNHATAAAVNQPPVHNVPLCLALIVLCLFYLSISKAPNLVKSLSLHSAFPCTLLAVVINGAIHQWSWT